MACYFEIICGILALIVFGHYYYKSKFRYWKDRGVVGPKPVPFLGSMSRTIMAKLSTGDYMKNLYNEYKDAPLIGMFRSTTPILIVRDPELIKDLLIKNFTVFADRGLATLDKAEPLTQNLFALEPERWRPLRAQFSPIFTSGKLKDMFLMILECSENFEKYMETVVARNEDVNIRDVTAKFTTDVIGTCAFGVDTKSLGDEDSEFRRMGKFLFRSGFTQLLRVRLRQLAPRFYNFLGNFLPHLEMTKFFMKLTMDTIKYRKANNIIRNDFISALMELHDNPNKLGIKLTDGLIASQSFVFFAAGFETSSSTISNALYEMALNPELQEELREEIKETYERTNGDLQYQTIKEMKLLDRVFRETLRKYPPITVLFRKTVSDYTFQGTNVSISKGINVWIPVYALHRDPNIYPNPDKFDPERFSDEQVAQRHPMTYLPFGHGPRSCIGSRFATYQTKVGLIKILRNYKVDVCEKTPIPYINDPRQFFLTPMGGMHLKLKKLESN